MLEFMLAYLFGWIHRRKWKRKVLVPPPEDYQPLLAREMPKGMVEIDSMMITRPLFQFIADWNWLPHRREEMLEGEPPEDSDPFLLAATASVVGSLCDRDGIEPPRWTEKVKLEQEYTMSGREIETPWGQIVKSEAPAACHRHGVYFEAAELGKTMR